VEYPVKTAEDFVNIVISGKSKTKTLWDVEVVHLEQLDVITVQQEYEK